MQQNAQLSYGLDTPDNKGNSPLIASVHASNKSAQFEWKFCLSAANSMIW